MKKIIYFLICLCLITGILAGCGNNNNSAKSDKLSIVTTIFPEYDWVREILGDKINDIELTMLLDKGVDLHSYQPSVDDIIKISTCDIFIYVGGESDKWVDDALKEATNKDMIIINLLDVLGNMAKVEESKEGMEVEDSDDDEQEFDEHVWLSLKNAKVFCEEITNKLSKLDADNKDTYIANLDAYIQKLTSLDAEYQKAVDSATKKAILFGDRFPFRYLVDDYNLDYYAAFMGCSAETEASFETITFLANKINELSLTCILTIEGTNHKIAETIVSNTTTKEQQIFSIDSLQSTTSNDVKNGKTYLLAMEKNLEVLKTTLK